MIGDSDRVSEKWMQPLITEVLINMHWRINQCIDADSTKPSDVNLEVWKKMKAMRATEVAQAKSEHMRSISKEKDGMIAQMKAIERQVVLRLVRIFVLGVQYICCHRRCHGT